jgi:hypothetical protein
MLRLISILEDACTVLMVAFFFGALAAGSAGYNAGPLWSLFWAALGGVVLASGALLRIGPGAIAKIIKARAQAMAEQKP